MKVNLFLYTLADDNYNAVEMVRTFIFKFYGIRKYQVFYWLLCITKGELYGAVIIPDIERSNELTTEIVLGHREYRKLSSLLIV